VAVVIYRSASISRFAMCAARPDWDHDVAVVGGGPAGSTVATALARAGRRVLGLERDVFPRFHIGESQLPWSNEIFGELGVYGTIRDAGFVPKWGASFSTLDGRDERYADFTAAVETPTPHAARAIRSKVATRDTPITPGIKGDLVFEVRSSAPRRPRCFCGCPRPTRSGALGYAC